MPTPAILERLADARAAIDAHDSEFTAPPWTEYSAVEAELYALPAEEREALVLGLDSARADIRREAANAVRVLRVASAAAADALDRGLVDSDAKVREACAEALATIAPARALAAIADTQAKVSRYALADAAKAAVAAEGAKALDALVRSGANAFEQADAWSAMYDHDRAACERNFAAKLELDPADVLWVLGVADIVRAKGGEWARAPFERLATHEDARVRRAAGEALAALGGQASFDPLLEVLARANARIPVHYALNAVFEAGQKAELPIAARAIAATPSFAYAQEHLFFWLARVCVWPWEAPSRAAIEQAVRERLAHGAIEVVASAAHTAVALGGAALVDAIIGALGHPRWYEKDLHDSVRKYLAGAGPEATRAVAAAIARGGAIAEVAVHTIAKLPDARAHVPVLVAALRTGSPKLREGAARTLGDLGATEACDALLEAARKTEEPNAIRALGLLGDARIVPLALASLAAEPLDREPAVYWRSDAYIEVLGRFGGRDAVDTLVRLVAHRDMRLRRDAAGALGRTRDRAALPHLAKLLGAPERQVREAAKRATAEIEG